MEEKKATWKFNLDGCSEFEKAVQSRSVWRARDLLLTDSAIVGVSFISQAGSVHFLGTSYSVTDVSERRDGHELGVLWKGESVQEITSAR